MIDIRLFRLKLMLTGFSQKRLAEEMKLSSCAMSKKVNGKTEFTASEIYRCSKLLGLTADERDRIFFPETDKD